MSNSAIHSTSSEEHHSAFGRVVILGYGVLTYGFFFVTFLYTIGFVGGFGVPKAIDDGAVGPVGVAVLVNLSFLGLFAIQHTIMARPGFKTWFTKFVPASVERTTYVFLTSLILCGMVWQWRPLPDTVWQLSGAPAVALDALCWIGWGVVLLSTFLIDHFELFGLRQTWAASQNKPVEPVHFQERLLYKVVRHPLMLGFLIAFWSASTMSEGRLFFCVVTTAYVLLALVIEERTLVHLHGEVYEDYRRRVPLLIPWPRRG